MAKEIISITRALAEMKLLKKRIDKSILKANLVTCAKSSSDNITKDMSKDDFRKNARAKLQSIQDLIDRLNKIQSAVAINNATQKVLVADKEYTVAEAINRKNTIEYEKELVDKLEYQLISSRNTVDMNNEVVEQRLQELMNTMVGKDSANNTSKEALKMGEQYREDNEYAIVDGLNSEALIEEMREEIDEFLFEVDFALSTSNTMNEIEI